MANKKTKKCPFCAEEILSEAKKCKHCGEIIDETNRKTTAIFNKYEEWLKQNYPAYLVIIKNENELFLVLNKEYKNFNILLFIILLLLWVLPGVIYALITLTNKKIITLTVHLDKNGRAINISNKKFSFLIDKYNTAQNR